MVAALGAFASGEVVPRALALLRDGDPIPLYALKLLACLCGAAPETVPMLAKAGLATPIVEALDVKHRANNVHNVRLVGRLLSHPTTPKVPLFQLGVASRLLAVAAYAADHRIDSFLEPCASAAAAALSWALAAPPGSADAAERAGLVAELAAPKALCVFLSLAAPLRTEFSAAEPAAAAALAALRLQPSAAAAFCETPAVAVGGLRRALAAYATGEAPRPAACAQLLKAVETALTSAANSRGEVAAVLTADDSVLLCLRQLAAAGASDPHTAEAAAATLSHLL